MLFGQVIGPPSSQFVRNLMLFNVPVQTNPRSVPKLPRKFLNTWTILVRCLTIGKEVIASYLCLVILEDMSKVIAHKFILKLICNQGVYETPQ